MATEKKAPVRKEAAMGEETAVSAAPAEAPVGMPERTDVFPDFAISLEEANRRVKMLAEFVRDHMVEGEDYGVIPGTNTKPTLFKPGAEKLNAIFGLAPIVEITSRVEDWDKGFVAYEVKVKLVNKRTQEVEAEGIGNCNSRERRYKNQDAANIANTILKMAKKRSLVDATLSATRASGLFTQDLEDLDLDADRNARSDRSEARNDRNGNDGRSDGRGERPAPTFQPARRDGDGAPRGNGGNDGRDVLTEAQRGAILAIANKAFGSNSKTELDRMVGKPIATLSRREASDVIDRLQAALGETSGRENAAYNRSDNRAEYSR